MRVQIPSWEEAILRVKSNQPGHARQSTLKVVTVGVLHHTMFLSFFNTATTDAWSGNANKSMQRKMCKKVHLWQ